jgi:IgA Peptidase M64
MPATGTTVAPEIRPLLTGGEDAWRLVIIGDRFELDQRNAFFAYCQMFANELIGQAPFSDPDLRDRIQVYACFTPTTPGGMFRCRVSSERRIYGQPALVRDYIALHRDVFPALRLRSNDLVLILMNFVERGGAGESGGDNICWTTPVPWLGPDQRVIEQWTDVALHELGHAFDLDDEYEKPWPDAPDVPTRANVSASDDPAQVPWTNDFDPDPPVTLRFDDRNIGTANPDWPTAAEIAEFGAVNVGMFQGARYSSKDYWRSALRCKMRSTPQPFCKVCQGVIRRSIAENA